jgi:hypothetical protein
MLLDTLTWIIILALGAGIGVAYMNPLTQPYVKKYWWAGVGVVVVLLGFMLLRRRGGNKIDAAIEEGQQIGAKNLTALDGLVDRAQEGALKADADLKRRLLKTEEERMAFDAKVGVIGTIDNSMERRKALIKLVEGQS